MNVIFYFKVFYKNKKISELAIFSDSINFKTKKFVYFSYQYTKVYSIEDLTNYSVQNVQRLTTTFQLILNVINLNKCKLNTTFNILVQETTGQYFFLI